VYEAAERMADEESPGTKKRKREEEAEEETSGWSKVANAAAGEGEGAARGEERRGTEIESLRNGPINWDSDAGGCHTDAY
jgi:hypothetical protein